MREGKVWQVHWSAAWDIQFCQCHSLLLGDKK